MPKEKMGTEGRGSGRGKVGGVVAAGYPASFAFPALDGLFVQQARMYFHIREGEEQDEHGKKKRIGSG